MPKLTMMHSNGVDASAAAAVAGNPHDDRHGVMAAAAAADPLGTPAAMAVGSHCALAAQGKDGGRAAKLASLGSLRGLHRVKVGGGQWRLLRLCCSVLDL